MKITEKINLFITLLLIAIMFNSYSMEKRETSGWEQIVAGVLLGAVALKTLWQQQPQKNFSFTELPEDIQNTIIELLSLNINAYSLENAAFTINSLTQVNKKLNLKINNPNFCLKLIKHLAQKFNCSDEEATKALQTQEAQWRLSIQEELKRLCLNPRSYSNGCLNELLKDGLDLDFTYLPLQITGIVFPPGKPVNAAIMMICTNNIQLLHEFLTIKKRFKEDLKLNSMFNLSIGIQKPDVVKYFLGAGVDPELPLKDGTTPLQLAQQTGNPEVINIIQNAIDKKLVERMKGLNL